MEYEDAVVLPTPEGVELRYVLAGLGSRLGAEVIDLIIRGFVLGAVALLLFAVGPDLSNGVAVAVLSVVGFLLLFAYDVLFEVLSSGRTPGKKWTGLRVVLASGRPIGWGASAVRNLLKLIDGPLTGYLLGTVSILVTERNQRVGDLAAGSLVVRDAGKEPAGLFRQHRPLEEETRLDVSAVSREEVATLREFLLRRETLKGGPRADLAVRLAEGIAPKVGGLPPAAHMPAEQFLEAVVAVKEKLDAER